MIVQFGPAKVTVSGTCGVYNGIAPLRGNINSTFGAAEPFRVDPPPAGFGLGPHGGCDIDDNLEANGPILAPAPGEVVEVGVNDLVGNFIRLNHSEGVVSKYLHMREHAHNGGGINLQVGDWVKRHAIIGNVGTTGKWSTGPHLHWSCRVNGVLVDPLGLVVEELTEDDITGLTPSLPYPEIGDETPPLSREQLLVLVSTMVAQEFAGHYRGINYSYRLVERPGRYHIAMHLTRGAIGG